MLEQSRKEYFNSKKVRKRFIIQGYLISILIFLISIIIAFFTKQDVIVPILTVVGGFIGYGYYYGKTGGYKYLYEQYFNDVVNELARTEKIYIRDISTYDISEEEVQNMFKSFKDCQVYTTNHLELFVEDVRMDVVHSRITRINDEKLKPLFDGTLIRLETSSNEDFYFDKDSSLKTDMEYIKRVQDALGEDIMISQKNNIILVATPTRLEIKHQKGQTFDVYRRTIVYHYDDLDRVVDGWKYYKTLKNILMK